MQVTHETMRLCQLFISYTELQQKYEHRYAEPTGAEKAAVSRAFNKLCAEAARHGEVQQVIFELANSSF